MRDLEAQLDYVLGADKKSVAGLQEQMKEAAEASEDDAHTAALNFLVLFCGEVLHRKEEGHTRVPSSKATVAAAAAAATTGPGILRCPPTSLCCAHA